MSPLSFVLFLAFGVCVLGHFYMARQARRALADRHPEAWRDLSSRSFFIDNAVIDFIMKKRHLRLSDPELERMARRMRWLWLTTILVWLAQVAALFSSFD